MFSAKFNHSNFKDSICGISSTRKPTEHTLVKGCGKKFCKSCYKFHSQSQGRQWAKNKTKKVKTYCMNCPQKPFLCMSCFDILHH